MKKLFFLNALMILLVFISFSCREENISNNETIEQNIKTLLIRSEQNSDKLLKLMKNVSSKNFISEMKSCKSENELLAVLHKNGINDPEKFVTILKEQEDLQNNFYIKNKYFYDNYNFKDRERIINQEISKNIIIESNPKSRTCYEQYLIDLKRNNRNYIICLGGAWATGITSGGIGGVIVAAGCVAMKHFGEQDAVEDYNDCRN